MQLLTMPLRHSKLPELGMRWLFLTLNIRITFWRCSWHILQLFESRLLIADLIKVSIGFCGWLHVIPYHREREIRQYTNFTKELVMMNLLRIILLWNICTSSLNLIEKYHNVYRNIYMYLLSALFSSCSRSKHTCLFSWIPVGICFEKYTWYTMNCVFKCFVSFDWVHLSKMADFRVSSFRAHGS